MSRCRQIRGLSWARPCGTPGFATGSRPRGTKRKGIVYERALEKALGAAGAGWCRGQWFEFLDANGHGFAQVDFIRPTADAVVVLESKLTWTMEGHYQLELLYRPLVEAIWQRPMIGVLVAKRLLPECSGAIAHTLPSAIIAAKTCRNVVLHWSGEAALAPLARERVRLVEPRLAGAKAALTVESLIG